MHLDVAELKEIITFAARLHQTINTDTSRALLPNREMRKLNHEHIFIYPYLSDNGLNLDDILLGLQEVGLPLRRMCFKTGCKKIRRSVFRRWENFTPWRLFPRELVKDRGWY